MASEILRTPEEILRELNSIPEDVSEEETDDPEAIDKDDECHIPTVSTAQSSSDDSDAETSNPQVPQVHVEGVLDRKAGLPCDIIAPSEEDSPLMILWFRESDGIPIYSYDLRGRPEGKPKTWSADHAFGKGASFTTASSPAKLIIDKVLLAYEDIYRCRVDFVNSPTRNSKVNFTVVVPPEKAFIYDEVTGNETKMVEAYAEDSTPRFRCDVTGGRPPPKVLWYLDSVLIDDSYDVFNDKTVNTVRLPKLTRANVNSQLKCVTSNTQHISPLSKTLSLDVYLRPTSVTILKKDQPLKEGVPGEIECIVKGSRPEANVTWWKQTELIQEYITTKSKGGEELLSTLQFVPNSKDDNNILICRAENPNIPNDPVEESLKLNVLYSPVVTLKMGAGLDPTNIKEGDDVYFECLVQANPKIHKLTWYHVDNEVRHNASAGIIVSDKSLVLRRVTQSTAGRYSCLAVNSEGSARSDFINLRILHSPICKQTQDELVGALKQEKVGLTCKVEADPPLVEFRWTFNHSGHSRTLPAEYYHNIGTTSSLNYTPFSDHDYGTLTCSAENSVGVQARPCIFQVVAAGRPFPLLNCTVGNRTMDALTVECIENFDGGLPQSFFAELVQLSNTAWRKSFSSAKPYFRITDLDSSAAYQLSLYARNAKGRSESTTLDIFAFNAEGMEFGGGEKIATFNIIVTVLSVALLVLIIVLVALCRTQLRNKSRDKLKYSSPLTESPENDLDAYKSKSKVIVDDRDPDIIPQKIEKHILPSFVSVCTTSPKHCKRKKPNSEQTTRHLNGTITSRSPHGEGNSSTVTATQVSVTKSAVLQESFL